MRAPADSAAAAAGQLQGERQRFRVTGASRTYVSSHSWLEVDYASLAHNAQARSRRAAPALASDAASGASVI